MCFEIWNLLNSNWYFWHHIVFFLLQSSLLMAILGEMPVTKGSIEVKGRIGYASQQAWIFSGSVRENIVFGHGFDEDRYQKTILACALKKVGRRKTSTIYVQDAIMLFKCINNFVPDFLKNIFVLRSQKHSRTTRNIISRQLDIPKCRPSTGQRSFFYRGCKLWNSLSNEIRLTDKVNNFKNKVISKFRSKYSRIIISIFNILIIIFCYFFFTILLNCNWKAHIGRWQ